MLKLSEPADLSEDSNIRTICLPFIAFGYPQSMDEDLPDPMDAQTDAIPIRDNNFLRNIRINQQLQSTSNHSTRFNRQSRRSHTRRNDKFLHGNLYAEDTQSSRTLQVLMFYHTPLFQTWHNYVFPGFTIHGLYSNGMGSICNIWRFNWYFTANKSAHSHER